jgi:glycosyltransferase involved in cell wall biosynthesis
LLQAQKELWEEGIKVPLQIIGAKHDDSPVVSQDGVTYAYNQPHDKVMGAWRHASLGIVPSIVPEAFGQVVVESMGAMTPVIATRHGGIIDIVEEGVQGLLIEPNSVTDLKRAIKELWLDPERRRKMGAAGPARAEKFVISKVLPMVQEAYDDVIKKSKVENK